MTISIELDVYSGRPNPFWAVKNGEAKQLDSMLHNLPVYSGAAYTTDLGYKGFILTKSEGGKSEVFRVFKGTITAIGGNGKSMVDKMKLEEKLLRIAGEKGYGDLLKN